MYTTRTGLTLGFHGTDQSIVDELLKGGTDLKPRNNPYDWLGYGIYFWDNSASRAFEWAEALSQKTDSTIKKPAVIGAIIDLGNCLDLLDYSNIPLVHSGYKILETTMDARKIPINKGGNDRLHRELDCASIEALHTSMKKKKHSRI